MIRRALRNVTPTDLLGVVLVFAGPILFLFLGV